MNMKKFLFNIKRVLFVIYLIVLIAPLIAINMLTEYLVELLTFSRE